MCRLSRGTVAGPVRRQDAVVLGGSWGVGVVRGVACVLRWRWSGPFGKRTCKPPAAVDLPYAGDELSMTVLLPDSGRFREFEDSLDSALVDRIMAGLEFRYVTLDLPRFEFESQAPPPASPAWTDAHVSRGTPSACTSGRWSTRRSRRWTRWAPRRPRPPRPPR